MGFRSSGDGRCDHCNQPGEPYVYRDIRFDGLIANRGERLCSRCADRALAAEAPEPSASPIAYGGRRFGATS